MKLLVLTQKIDLNDDVLGFFNDWLAEMAGHCEQVTAICLYQGKHNLPANVRLLSLGKESGTSRLKYLYRFYKYIWQERKNYDSVFVHMNQIYVILGAPLWRLWRKKIGLWYAHGKVSFSLKVAEKLTDLIFTSTVEGCRLNSNKIRIVGQGIDIEKFKVQSDSDSCHPRPRRARINSSGDPEISSKLKVTGDIFKIITIGRISPAKDYETLIRAAEILKKENLRFRIEIIGGVGAPEQEKYLSELKKMVADLGLGEEVIFAGGIPHEEIMNYLAAANLFANMSQTGSLDKAILEAMAAGLSVVTSNEAAVKMLSAFAEQMVFPQKDFRTLAERIKFFIKLSNSERIKYGESLRKIVETEHGLKGLIEKIIKNYA